MARINVNDIDDELLEQIKKEVANRGCTKTDMKGIIRFLFNDYLQMSNLSKFENPLLVKLLQQTFRSELDLMEQRLGGRLFKLVGDNSISISMLMQMYFDSMTKFDDPKEAALMYERYRKTAVDNLREKKMPISYRQLIKDDENE